MEYNNPNIKKEKLINENTTNYYEIFNTINLKNMTYLNKGSCAKIYYNKRIILKKYYSETPINLRIKEDIFNILKDINNRNFIELYDIYSTYKENLNHQSITSAYTAKYYKDNSINPILENKNYLLENFNNLEKLFDIFTNNMICTSDIKRDNSILEKNNIIIIDPDLFYIINSTKTFLRKTNKIKLLYLFNSIIINSIDDDLDYPRKIRILHNLLSDIIITDKTNITYELSKKLQYIKKPIDIFKK